MTNAYFKSISDYRDIESINAYKEYTESGLMTEEECELPEDDQP